MKRRLAAMEQMMWRGSLENPTNFTLTALLKGQLSSDHLREALERLKLRHKNLALRVELDEYGRILFNTDDVADFDIRETTRGDWTIEAERELRTPFNWRTGALVRFVLMQDAESTDLIITSHHCAYDGLSAAYLLRDILQTIANPTTSLEPLPEFLGIDRLMPRLDSPAESTYSRPLVVKGKDRHALYDSEQSLSETRITILAWSMDATALVDRCKREAVGVHSAICAAWLLAFAEVSGNQAPYWRRLSNPVSLRKWLTREVGESLGMYITPQLILGADCSPSRKFWDIARELMSALKNTATEANLFAPHIALREVLKTIDDDKTPENDIAHDVTYDLAVTNLGVLDFPSHYGDLELQAIYAPTVNGYGTEKILGVTTFGGQLFFNFIVAEQVMGRDEVERLHEVAMGILGNMI